MESQPTLLSAEDRAILELEGPTVAGHTCKVILIGGDAPGFDELSARVVERLPEVPELRLRLSTGSGPPAWVATEPEPGEHLSFEQQKLDADRLREWIGERFRLRLDRRRPLWAIDAAPTSDGRLAVVWRLHHALADGTTAIRLARELLWDLSATTPAPPHAGVRETDADRRRGHLAAFVRRELSESVRQSPFAGEIGAEREVAFCGLSLRALHDAAKELAGATVNDAVLCVVGGAVGRWLGPAVADRSIRLRVPVSLHHEGDDAGNRDSFFTLPVAVDGPPEQRLRAIATATAERKHDHDAERLDELVHGAHGRAVAHAFSRLQAGARSFALCVSNVPGPRQPVEVCGAPVEGLYSLAEIGRSHALRVAVVSLADRLGFGLCADPGIVPRLPELAEGIEAEAEQLIAATAR